MPADALVVAEPAAVAIPQSAIRNPQSNSRMLLIAAGIMTFAIIFIALIAILIASRYDNSPGVATNGKQPPPLMASKVIPMRVIDPLGGENEDNLDDLIASWEVEEKEIDAKTVGDVKVDSADTADADLNVTAAFLADRQAKSLEPRNAETGIRPAGLNVPKELFGDGVIKQKRKLAEMKASGYHQPLDFSELAEKRLKKELIETGFVYVTRKGHMPSTCELLALTWFPLDVSNKFDPEALACFEAKAYRKNAPLPMPVIKPKTDWTLPNGGREVALKTQALVHH